MKKEYRLNLLKTDFLLNNSHQSKKSFLDVWGSGPVVDSLHRTSNGRPWFFLHDGPPYANGSLHAGHFVNKTLKDAVLRFKRLQGFFAPFLPGFDCHGLPVELAVEKLGFSRTNKAEFLQQCRGYAEKQIQKQVSEFKEFGVLADWNEAYQTMSPKFEAHELQWLLKWSEDGRLEQKFRPVHWCPQCQSSLAEAEVEYKMTPSESVVVHFPLLGSSDVMLKVWTTTPYTLPANQAVGFNPNMDYYKVWNDKKRVYEVSLDYCDGAQRVSLEKALAKSPYTQEEVPVLPADFVTRVGTGLVHLAPSFGLDDFRVGERYGLAVKEWTNEYGNFVSPQYPDLDGKPLNEVSNLVLACLASNGLLTTRGVINHEYPHCWRHQSPLFSRASREWFLSVAGVKPEALKALERVSFYPPSSRGRLQSMVEARDSWCVSRNRTWGVPLPVGLKDANGDPVSQDVLDRAVLAVHSRGVEGWHQELADAGVPSGHVLDVWIDSGMTPLQMPESYPLVADLVMEGSDQCRGWFQSSLWVGLLAHHGAPYKAVFTHGFVVDEDGKKLSKSSPNYMPLQAVFREYSPDVLRLWVLLQDVKQDLRFSKNNLKQVVEVYKKLRNTFRFCLQNTQDYPWKNLCEDLKTVTDPYAVWVLDQLRLLLSVDSLKDVNQYEFSEWMRRAYQQAEALSGFFDYQKDVLYCEPAHSKKRRKVQSVLAVVLRTWMVVLSPALPYTAEEVFGRVGLLLGFKQPSVGCVTYADAAGGLPPVPEDSSFMEEVFALRQDWNRYAEKMQKEDAEFERKAQSLTLSASPEFMTQLRGGVEWDVLQFMGCAEVNWVTDGSVGVRGISLSSRLKCPRCRSFVVDPSSPEELCLRCHDAEILAVNPVVDRGGLEL